MPAASQSGTAVKAEAPPDSEPTLTRGTDIVVAPPRLQGLPATAPTSFNFEDAPVQDVVNVLMRDMLHADFVIHPPISGTVTLATRTDVSGDQAVFLLESALQANGLQMVRDPRGVYHVGKPEVLKGIGPAVRQMEPGKVLPPGTGAIVVPLQYIGANEMAAILKPMLPPDALLRVDPVRNLLVLGGSRSQAEGWLDLVRTFDVNLLKGMSVGIFPLKYVTTKEVEAALKLLSAGTGGSAGASAAPAQAAPGSVATALASGGLGASSNSMAAAASSGVNETLPLFGAIRILTVERLNAVMVVTPRAAYLEEAKNWIDSLDKPTNNSGEPQLFVYPVQNGNAKHLASVVGGLFGGTSSGSTGNTGVAPGLTSGSAGTTLGNNSSFGNSSGYGGTGGLGSTSSSSLGTNRSTMASANSGANVTGYNLGPNVRLIADSANNAILVYASRADFNKIETALKRLDVPATQVLIEATIVEVSLTGNLSYGLQWAFNNGLSNGRTGAGVLTTNSTGVISSVAQGFTYTLKNSAGSIQAVLNALASETNVNVLSSPSLMVVDNYTANIMVGTQQPISGGSSVTSTGVVTSNVQYKDTGVNLMVTPSVNSGNMVTMEINQNVTDVASVPDEVTKQYPFTQRQVTSKVAVRSGETIVLGGMIRENKSNSSAGLPILSSLPVVGALFGAKNVGNSRTELLVVITPKVVRSDQEIRDVSDELRDKMRGLSLSNIQLGAGSSSNRVPTTSSVSTLK
ncbi:MAG: type II secretion system protein GspD [Curvibacter sp.]|nr:MAG: type II secretion system protein GspD [Curvibacter sp.]